MYVRKNGDQDLTLVVSGMLWKRSLIMKDLETESLWSHLLGKSMEGKLKDTQLKTLPSLLTDWKTWKQKYPDTSVVMMSPTDSMFTRKMYKNLGDFLVGMATPGEAKAWRFNDLQTQPVVNDSLGEQPVLIYFDEVSSTPFVYSRQLNDQVLTFDQVENVVTDEETNSTWDLMLGTSTEGPLKDQRLMPLVGIPSFKRAWDNFYPESVYWKPEK